MTKSDSIAHLLTALSSRQQLEGLHNMTGVARGTAEVLAWTDDEPPVGAGTCHQGRELQPDPTPSRDQEGCLASASLPSFTKGLLRVANSVLPDLPLRLRPVMKGPAV